jgi:hypothetical protein
MTGFKLKILEKVIKKMVRGIKLKDILVKVGDAYVKATKSETDDKVWKQIKAMIKEM